MQEQNNNLVLENLKNKRDYHLNALNILNGTIALYESPSNEENNLKRQKPEVKGKTQLAYSRNFSPANKFVYFLKTENRFLHFREVAHLILGMEGVAINKENVKVVMDDLYSGTQVLKKNGTIEKYQATKSFQGTYWGSPKWFDKDRKPKKEHACNLDFGSTKEKQVIFDL